MKDNFMEDRGQKVDDRWQRRPVHQTQSNLRQRLR